MSLPLLCFYQAKLDKKHMCDEEQVCEVEEYLLSIGVLLLWWDGTMAAATVIYKWLATLISEKHGHPYSQTLFWIRCKLSSLPRSAIMCLRGS